MKKITENHLKQVLKHLYINPLERCNLRCKICYTRKTDPTLSKVEILDFIEKYEKEQTLETVTFCGGEVFVLPYFCAVVNFLTNKNIFVQIITNGTIDKLKEFNNPNLVNLIVSIDGMQKYHDLNRGEGNFDKSITFLKKAIKLGFHTEIFSIVTKQNLSQLDLFENNIKDILNKNIPITYHPRKPPEYLMHHPISNIKGEVDNFDFLSAEELIMLMKNKNTFPPKNLGCYQIAVASDGKIYGCCEGTIPLGNINDSVDLLIEKMKERLESWEKSVSLHNCLGCSSPDFVCGIKSFLTTLDS